MSGNPLVTQTLLLTEAIRARLDEAKMAKNIEQIQRSWRESEKL